MTGRTESGFTMVEALVAVTLAALALAALAAACATATVALVRAGERQAMLAGAADRLETLTLGPDGVGADVITGPPAIARTWARVPGRGRVVSLAVETRLDARSLRLESARWP